MSFGLYPLRCSCLIIALGSAAAGGSAQAQNDRGDDLLSRVAQTLGFDAKDRDRVRAGGIASRAQSEAEDELGAALALVIKCPVDVIYQAVESGDIFKIDRGTLDSHQIDPETSAAAFSGLKLPAEQIEELRDASPGAKLNLSKTEIGTLRAAADSGVLAAYRSILATRVSAYQRGGFGAIAPYARGGDASNPGRELKAATDRLVLLPKEAPEFWLAFTVFPVAPAPGVEHQFWWQLLEVEKKPTPILEHRLFQQRDGHALIARRQFYVARSYNALQIVVGIFALDANQSVVIYVNRTFTDQVAGFGSGARHRIGRGMMIDEVSSFMEAIRKELEAS